VSTVFVMWLSWSHHRDDRLQGFQIARMVSFQVLLNFLFTEETIEVGGGHR
jgi:hypothetical protein